MNFDEFGTLQFASSIPSKLLIFCQIRSNKPRTSPLVPSRRRARGSVVQLCSHSNCIAASPGELRVSEKCMKKNVDDESCCWSILFVYYSSIFICCSIRIYLVEALRVRNYIFAVPCGENRGASFTRLLFGRAISVFSGVPFTRVRAKKEKEKNR